MGIVPASLYHPNYIDFCRRHLGHESERALGEDIQALARLLPTHDALAKVQVLSWLFDSVDASVKSEHLEFNELADFDGVRSGPLSILRGTDVTTLELLRCSVALEREAWACLPSFDPHPTGGLATHLQELAPFAPMLKKATVKLSRALGHRGRALGSTIFVGLPRDPFGDAWSSTEEHIALQAAHEATVLELIRKVRLPFFELEHAALTVLRTRIAGSPWGASHRRWLLSHDLSAFGGVEGLVLEQLSSPARRAAQELLQA